MPITTEIRWRAAVIGVLATVAGLSVGELAASAITPLASPFRAVGALLVDRSPAAMREFAIETFGTADKTALFVGIGLALLGVAALAGVLQARRPPLGALVVVAVGCVGVYASLTRPTASASYALPSILAAATATILLVGLCRNAVRPRSSSATGWNRRRFLAASAALAGVVVLTHAVARTLSRAADAVTDRSGLRLPTPQEPAAPIPAGTEVRADGVTPFLTANDRFYRIDTALQVPRVRTTDWRLRIHGMVDRDVTLSWDDLVARPMIERIVTLTCVSNEVGGDLAGNARWLGTPMRDLLDEVGIRPGADMLLSTSVDGWTSGTPLSALTDGRDAMLAIGMNGSPLPFEHGYPVRQVVTGLYGFVSACKWVTDWEITRFDRAQAYWTRRGWGMRAPIKTASRIDRPAPLSTHAPGRVVVAGTAWAQHRGVRAVEVRVDDGPWSPATLATEYSTDTWRQWTWDWDATPGQHTLQCRATDAAGRVQPEARVAPIPDGATGWHSRVFRVDG
ncbi:molybdopterin-dependent oxidoreductase [Gordonia sinesedis]